MLLDQTQAMEVRRGHQVPWNETEAVVNCDVGAENHAGSFVRTLNS